MRRYTAYIVVNELINIVMYMNAANFNETNIHCAEVNTIRCIASNYFHKSFFYGLFTKLFRFIGRNLIIPGPAGGGKIETYTFRIALLILFIAAPF